MQESSDLRILVLERRCDQLDARLRLLEGRSIPEAQAPPPPISGASKANRTPEAVEPERVSNFAAFGEAVSSPEKAAPSLAAVSEPLADSPILIPAPPKAKERAARVSKMAAVEWESLLGGRYALWLGALCLFLAVASLVAYSWRTLPPPPPWARVAMGIGASWALLAAAFWVRPRVPRWFSEGLGGTGLAVGFLSAWAGSQLYHLWSGPFALVALAFWTVLGTGLALRFEARSLLLLAAAGGFLTPALVPQSGAAPLLSLLMYLLVLNGGVVLVAALKSWRETLALAGIATLGFLLWARDAQSAFSLAPLFQVFAALYLGIFGAAILVPHWKKRRALQEFDLAFLSCASLSFWAFGVWLWPQNRGVFALVFAAALALLWWGNRRIAQADARLSLLFALAGALSFLAFFPMQSGVKGAFWGWMLLAVACEFLGVRWESRWFQSAARGIWVLSLSALLWLAMAGQDEWGRPLFCALISSAGLLWSARQRGEESRFVEACAAFLVWGGALWGAVHNPLDFVWEKFFAKDGPFVCALIWGIVWGLGALQIGRKTRFYFLENNGWVLGALSLFCVFFYRVCLLDARLTPFWNGGALCMACGFLALVAVSRWLRGDGSDGEAAREFLLGGAFLWGTLGLWMEWRGVRLGAESRPLWLCAILVFPAICGAIVGFRTRLASLRSLSYCVLAGAMAGLLLVSLWPCGVWTPLWNGRLLAFLSAFLIASGVAWLQDHFASRLSPSERAFQPFWTAPLFLLPLWATTQEIWNGALFIGGPNAARFGSLGVSLWWSLFALAALVWGVLQGKRALRLAGLALLGLTLGKVFLLDLAFLDGSLKVLSLGGLGASLIGVSWLYSRLENREAPEDSPIPQSIP